MNGGANPSQGSATPRTRSADNPNSVFSRWLRITEWVLVILLTAHFGVRSLPRAWRTLNTDFPDYYVAARLAYEHNDTSRIYDWIWFERQKDHRGIDQRIVNLTPSTTFSTLAVYPLAGLPALAAKRCWLICNLGLLIATLFLLHALTHLSWRRIVLLAALSLPLRMNFVTGQYYVLLLFLLSLACYLYLRQQRFMAGIVVGIASGLKIFPVIYLLYFLRKRDLRALSGGVVAALCTAITAVLVFGWEANRIYLGQVLPATLRGEAMAPYALKIASLASLLHRLFIFEPQLNPHPAISAAWLFAVVHPVLQMAIMAPALLLANPGESSSRRVRLEWIAILLASLTISTSPQSYLFTLLILPACVILEAVEGKKPYLSLATVVVYVAAGFLSGTDLALDGWRALLGVPRLYVLILFCILAFAVLMSQPRSDRSKPERPVWVLGLAVLAALSVLSGLHRQQGLYEDYRWRLSTPQKAYMVVQPAVQGNVTLFVAMLGDGYHLAEQREGSTQFSRELDDQLAVTVAGNERWVEQAGIQSTIASTRSGRSTVDHAQSPVASLDGRRLAFLREDHGRTRLWVRAVDQPGKAEWPVSPLKLNVLEASFLPTGELIFAAASDGRPSLFVTDGIENQAGNMRSFDTLEARYPAVSPDGRYLAYSRLQSGYWNLWLRDLGNGQTDRLTRAACNTVEPAWSSDSKTLVYASDCGRGLWFYSLSKRQVVFQ